MQCKQRSVQLFVQYSSQSHKPANFRELRATRPRPRPLLGCFYSLFSLSPANLFFHSSRQKPCRRKKSPHPPIHPPRAEPPRYPNCQNGARARRRLLRLAQQRLRATTLFAVASPAPCLRKQQSGVDSVEWTQWNGATALSECARHALGSCWASPHEDGGTCPPLPPRSLNRPITVSGLRTASDSDSDAD